jgi:hypothetical protein
MSKKMASIRIRIRVTPRRLRHLKAYTRALGMRRWKRYLEEAALDIIPSGREITEFEKA